MCKASLYANRYLVAEDKKTYAIRLNHGLPAFYSTNQSVADCLVFVPNGKILTLSNIPRDLRKRHGIRKRAIVTFIHIGDNAVDMLQIKGTKFVPLSEFANRGLFAYVGNRAVELFEGFTLPFAG